MAAERRPQRPGKPDARAPVAAVSAAGLRGLRVRDAAGEDVGRLRDLVVRWDAGDYPRLTGLVVRIGARTAFVHAGLIQEISPVRVQLRSTTFDLRDFQRRPGEWLVIADLLDHQLVDVDGARVVRASDLYLERVGTGYRLVGVDVSFASFLRRTLPGRLGRTATPERVLAWTAVQPFGRPGEPMRLRQPHTGLRTLRPADFADVLEALARPERAALLSQLDPEHAAQVLEEMGPDKVRDVLTALPAAEAAGLLVRMAPDEAGDALRDLAVDERAAVLRHMHASRSAELTRLAEFTRTQAGGLMTTRLALVRPDDTIGHAREVVAAHRSDGDMQGVVVVDDQGRLVDDLPLVAMIAADPASTVREVIGPPLPGTVLADASLAEVVGQLTANRRTSLLVVDDEERPIGRILADDVIDALVESRHARRWPWQPRSRVRVR